MTPPDNKLIQAEDAILTHPLHHENLKLVEQLITSLRNSSTARDLYLLQKRLFLAIQRAEQNQQEAEDHAQGIRLLKQELVRRGKKSGFLNKLKLWELQQKEKGRRVEIEVFKRIRRELREVGDGLLWTAVRFDRGYIVGVSDAPGTGNLHLSDAQGLAAELEEVERLWRTSEILAIMHDLTNCGRIGDLTLVHPRLEPNPVEVKRSQVVGAKQRERLVAVDRFVKGVPVAVDGGRWKLLRSVESPMRHHLDEYGRVLLEAGLTGTAGTVVEDYLGVVATDSLHLRWDLLREAGIDERTRDRLHSEAMMSSFDPLYKTVLRKKIIPRSVPHDVAPIISWDTSEKQTLEEALAGAPYSIYPFTPDVCARLTCGYMRLWLFIDMEAVLRRLRCAGFGAEIETEPAGKNQSFTYIWISRPKFIKGVGWTKVYMRLGKHIMQQVWGEGMSIETVAATARELFKGEIPKDGAINSLRYFDDQITWNKLHIYSPQLELGGRNLLLRVDNSEIIVA